MSDITIVIWIIGFMFVMGIYYKAKPETRWYDIPLMVMGWPVILGGIVSKYMSESKNIDNLTVNIGNITTKEAPKP